MYAIIFCTSLAYNTARLITQPWAARRKKTTVYYLRLFKDCHARNWKQSTVPFIFLSSIEHDSFCSILFFNENRSIIGNTVLF